MSYGLYAALQVSSADDVVPLTITEISDVQAKRKKEVCDCRSGEIASMQLRFLDRPRPPRAVVIGLQRIVTQVGLITLHQPV